LASCPNRSPPAISSDEPKNKTINSSKHSSGPIREFQLKELALKTTHWVGARPLVFLGCLLTTILGYAAQENRITASIDNSRTVILKGTPHSMVTPANDRGPLDPSKPIGGVRMALTQTAAQAEDLQQLLEGQRDPSSPDYQRWLTPEEYGRRFGVSPDDMNRITSWLQTEGFAIQQVARASNWVSFSGTAGQLGKTFRTELHTYQADGETHFANATPVSIPEALAGIVSELHGLDDFHPKPPRNRKLTPNLTASGGVHYLAPDDFAAIYDIAALYKAGVNGTGQKLAIAGQTDISLSDIRGFRAEFGLTAMDPQLVLYGPDPGVSPGDQTEADLDLEWSGAVARNATIVYVYSQDVLESVQYAIDGYLAPVISMSYGECEIGAPTSYRSMAQQANAEGMTWMNSSGDGGAAGCDYDAKIAVRGPAVTFPADIPEVTAVGGTELSENSSSDWSTQNSATLASATGYIPEIAWNDTALGGGIWATGGGVSVEFAKPWWQAGPGVPNDSARDVPDVSLSASGDHDGYLIYTTGELMTVGGTSAASPTFAGIVTLINQYLVAQGKQAKPGLGNINPNLYSLAQNTTGVIHDVTSGNNIVPCESGSTGCTSGSFGYTAGVGYDRVTGLGSVDAFNLVTKWSSVPVAVGTTMALTASATSVAQSATVQLTAKITAVTGSAGPSGAVTFMAGGATLGSAAAIVSGATATATLSVSGSSLPAGGDSITASFAPADAFTSSTGSVTVTVTAPVATRTTVAANLASIAAAGTAMLTATVTPASGSAAPIGVVTFLAGNTALGTATLMASGSAATAMLSVPGGSLAAGADSITASYAGGGSFTASVSPSITVTVAAPSIATTTSVAPNPASIAQSASTVLTVTVKPASGTVAPTGSVSFLAGGASLGKATLTASGANATAALTVNGVSLAGGSNTVTASYSGDSKCAASAGSVTVTVATPPVATTTVAAASPATVAQNATTQITAVVRPVSGTTLPGGTVSFTIGSTPLGSSAMTVSGGMAYGILSVAASKLAVGSNTIVASYSGSASFMASTSSVLVIVTGAPVTTTTTLTASPASIASSASTQLTVTVKAATGTVVPTGSVTFTNGSVALGTASLAMATMAASGIATATLTVKGSSLAAGSNSLVATYAGSASFSGSTGSVTVTVVLPPVATATLAAASPATVAQNAATQVTATVKPVTGTALPAGTVTFAIGNTSLGSATIATSGGMASAVLSVAASKLKIGSNTISATYSGSASFTASSSSVLVIVTAPVAAAAPVASSAHQSGQ
jgi:subtilase family serine protease